MKTLKYITFCIIINTVCACHQSPDKPQLALSVIENSTEANSFENKTINRPEQTKPVQFSTVSNLKHGEIEYSIHTMSALEFIKLKGENPEVEDIDQLREETVVFFEFESEESNILKSKKIQIPKNEVFQYLRRDILENVEIEQKGEKNKANGVIYDRSLNGTNKLRVILFFSTVNHEKEFLFNYKDKLFGAGEIELSNYNT